MPRSSRGPCAVLIAATALIVALSGCTGTSARPSGPASTSSAASALTAWTTPNCPDAKSVGSAFGAEASPRGSSGSAGASSQGENCYYTVESSGKPDLVTLTFAPLPGASYASFESTVNENDSAQSTVSPLEGYGQAAFTSTADSDGNIAVYVLENDVVFAIVTAAPLDGAKAFARQILAQSTHTAEPNLMPTQTSFDINSADAWRAACGIPASEMSSLLQGSGVDPITETAKGTTNDECMYQGSDPNKINTFGVALGQLGSGSGFGFGTDGNNWQGSDAASGYAAACAKDQVSTGNYQAICDPGIGSGLVISRDRTDAVLFGPGKYFYVLGFYTIGGTDALTPYYEAVASKLTALPAIE